MNGAEVNAVKA